MSDGTKGGWTSTVDPLRFANERIELLQRELESERASNRHMTVNFLNAREETRRAMASTDITAQLTKLRDDCVSVLNGLDKEYKANFSGGEGIGASFEKAAFVICASSLPRYEVTLALGFPYGGAWLRKKVEVELDAAGWPGVEVEIVDAAAVRDAW